MPYDEVIQTAENLGAPMIPVWSQSMGSWTFSLGRKPFLANELEGHYDREADTWHSTISKLGFADAYADLIAQAFSATALPPVDDTLQVLDAGVGTGAMSAALANRYTDSISLTGIDLSLDMLEQAEKQLSHGHLSARFLQADVNCLPFADDTFDVILVAHVLEHMADPKRALAELYRVLKPGGVLIACVTQRSPAGAFIQLKWRTHCVDAATVQEWFWGCSFTAVRALPFRHGTPARRLSCSYVGHKAHRPLQPFSV